MHEGGSGRASDQTMTAVSQRDGGERAANRTDAIGRVATHIRVRALSGMSRRLWVQASRCVRPLTRYERQTRRQRPEPEILGSTLFGAQNKGVLGLLPGNGKRVIYLGSLKTYTHIWSFRPSSSCHYHTDSIAHRNCDIRLYAEWAQCPLVRSSLRYKPPPQEPAHSR